MLIEDSVADAACIRDIFTARGYDVVWFENHRDASQALARNADAYGLILTDNDTGDPELDGVGFIERNVNRGKPVIALSSGLMDNMLMLDSDGTQSVIAAIEKQHLPGLVNDPKHHHQCEAFFNAIDTALGNVRAATR